MRQISLTQGQVALVDDADYDWLNQWKWAARKDHNENFYAVRSSSVNGKQYAIYMSRQVLGLEYGDKKETDHKNHNTLDNRRNNLRTCTHQENLMNQKSHLNSTSKFRGVYWDKLLGKWRAQIRKDGKVKHLGVFVLEELAALTYDMAAIREFGKFANLNF